METAKVKVQCERFLVGLLVLVAILPDSVCWSASDETSLRGSLVIGYETSVRPSETVSIFLTFQLTSIDDVNIKDQTFSVSGWWVMEWSDSRLTWSPASHSSIPVLQYYEDDLWTPAIVVSNSVTDLSAIDEDTIPLRVENTGEVAWNPPGIFKTKCDMDSTYFPFDYQTCSIQVTSFGYSTREVTLNMTRGLLMDYYSENGDWVVLDTWSTHQDYNDNGESYNRLGFYVKVRRLNTYHWLNIILPVIVSGVLVIFVFMLPVDSGEKMGYALTCLLTYVVLLTLIAANMPTSAKHTSFLEVYLTIVLMLSGVTVVLSIASIKLYNLPDEDRIPDWVIRLTRRCWPWVDNRKSSSDQKTPVQNLHPEEGKFEKQNTASGPRDLQNGETTRVTNRNRKFSSDTSSVARDYTEEEVTGRTVSIVMDAIMLRIYGALVPVMTLVFMVILMVGGG